MKSLRHFILYSLVTIFCVCCGSSDKDSDKDGKNKNGYNPRLCEKLDDKLFDADDLDEISQEDFSMMIDQLLALNKEWQRLIEDCDSESEYKRLQDSDEYEEIEEYASTFRMALIKADLSDENQEKLERVWEEIYDIDAQVQKHLNNL